jgi:hypothetical protein
MRLFVLQFVVAIVLVAAWRPASAETMKFEDAAGLLGDSCAKDIDANCRGVSLDPTRLKECLARNQDSVSAQCKSDSVRAFDAIQKRVSARSAVVRQCERDVAKLCGAGQKSTAQILECILPATRGVSVNCNKAIAEAGYR